MNRFPARVVLLVLPALVGIPAGAQNTTPHLQVAKARKAGSPARVASIGRQQLFGSIPVSTRSPEARKLIELSFDNYENHVVDGALANARKAIKKDPQFALGYAALSLASLGTIPDSAALARAKSLLPHATADEQLLIRWMTSISDRDVLPAIGAMNDLLKRYPENKHILYILADWLYSQQDYDRARQMLETVRRIDPDYPPALNLLGYAYVQTGSPDPEKAIASLQRYAAVLPNSPNPQDSLGEVLRVTGDDPGSLDHYAAALKIDPDYISSHYGLGDTSALMGNFVRASAEYDEAINVANNPRDRSHCEFQKALLYFWEGRPIEGRQALDALNEKVRQQREPYSQFEVAFGRAMLAAGPSLELEQLRWLETWLQDPIDGLSEAGRDNFRAQVLRERARVSARRGEFPLAEATVRKLEQLAEQSRDLLVENSFESASGYLLAAKGDLAGAVDALAADPRSLFALEQLAAAQEKLGDSTAAQVTRTRMKYLRAPTVEWYLLTPSSAAN
ncbi:MAG TPA: tetratricopeptide repeat protein [Candidatus Acidoferrum sp.]|nr:tetratricopeptide repeat protein [Candidatus Acidoferrum sp.]